MKSDAPEAVLNAETGGTLMSARPPIDAYAPMDAPLAMPTHQLEFGLSGWLRWLRARAEPMTRSKRNGKAGASAG